MTEQAKPFCEWCIVEIMGHQRYAGLVTEQAIGGGSMVRIDIPPVNGKKGFTKLFGGGSIYAITPLEEDAARAMATVLQVQPIKPWELPEEFQRKLTFNERGDDDEDHG